MLNIPRIPGFPVPYTQVIQNFSLHWKMKQRVSQKLFGHQTFRKVNYTIVPSQCFSSNFGKKAPGQNWEK